MFEKDHLESWLRAISAHIPESTVIYLIGGCALSFKGLYVTVPIHGNKEILPSTLLSIIRQAGMGKEEFIGLVG